jgi:hypothetical protein
VEFLKFRCVDCPVQHPVDDAASVPSCGSGA